MSLTKGKVIQLSNKSNKSLGKNFICFKPEIGLFLIEVYKVRYFCLNL